MVKKYKSRNEKYAQNKKIQRNKMLSWQTENIAKLKMKSKND